MHPPLKPVAKLLTESPDPVGLSPCGGAVGFVFSRFLRGGGERLGSGRASLPGVVLCSCLLSAGFASRAHADVGPDGDGSSSHPDTAGSGSAANAPDGGAYTLVPEGGIGDTGGGCAASPSWGESNVMVAALVAGFLFLKFLRRVSP